MDGMSKAFKSVPREDFLPDDVREYAEEDRPLPIGCGQTNSQPTTVRMMLEWLDARQGQKVLDVGYGSGWTTALLSQIVGKDGKVIAVERVSQLVEMGKQNCLKAGVENAEFHQTGEELGWQAGSPYARILVSAAARSLPESLVRQLSAGGRMVIPVGSRVLVINKDEKEQLDITQHPGFAFVPLI